VGESAFTDRADEVSIAFNAILAPDQRDLFAPASTLAKMIVISNRAAQCRAKPVSFHDACNTKRGSGTAKHPDIKTLNS
jgi:hypothetical protein